MRVAELYYQRVFLFATATLVCFALLGKHLGNRLSLIVLVLGVVLLGLPHGALDPLVAGRAFAAAHRRFNQVVFFFAYAGLAIAYGWLWVTFPTVGLVSFLVIAAFHFGSDWQPRGTVITRIAYGLILVTLPAAMHVTEVANIYAILGTSHASTIISASRICAPLAVAVAGGAAILRYGTQRGDLWELFAITLGAVLLQPLVFFTCYFTLLHSPRHLFETARLLGLPSLGGIFVKTIPVIGLTLLLCLGASFIIPASSVSQKLLTIVFVGLASLTAPHMVLEVIAKG